MNAIQGYKKRLKTTDARGHRPINDFIVGYQNNEVLRGNI